MEEEELWMGVFFPVGWASENLHFRSFSSIANSPPRGILLILLTLETAFYGVIYSHISF